VEIPETFYLDQERLRTLKAELHDMVYFDICYEIFGELLNLIDHRVTVTHKDREDLRNSIFAVLGEGTSFSNRQWKTNRDYISVELVRHALHICGYPHTTDAYLQQEADELLHQKLLFHDPAAFLPHAARLETLILPEMLECANSHLHASSMDMFNSLVAPSNPPPPPPTSQSVLAARQLALDDTVSPPSDRITDIAKRLAHIAVLHWRVWGPIVYVRPEEPALLSAAEVCGSPALCAKHHGEAIHATCTPSGTETTTETNSTSTDPSVGTRPLASQAPEAARLGEL
jgi:hypothetical protein